MTVRARCIVVLGLLLGGATSARADCVPAAVPRGDPALVRSVNERLAASGISTMEVVGCPVVHVSLEQRARQIHLQVTDVYQRLGERDVRDIATAAAIIESWTLQEIEEGTLPAEPPAEPTPETPHTGPALLAISASGLSSVADNGAIWLGGVATGCVRVGGSCIGARFDLAKDTTTTGETAGGNPTSIEVDALATFDLPRSFGSFTISPGIGIGYGWLQVTARHLDAHMMPFLVPASSNALRGEAHVAVSRTVSRHLAIYGELVGDGSLVRTDITAGARAWLGLSLGLRVEAL